MNTSRQPTEVRKSANDRTYQPKISVSPIQPTTTSAEPKLAQRYGRCFAGAQRTISWKATATSAMATGQRRMRSARCEPGACPAQIDGDRSERRGEDEDREPEREREADPPRPFLRRLVDLVEGADRRADDPGHLPDGEGGRECEQSRVEDESTLVHGLVDSVEDGGKDLRLDLRRDRLLPEVTLVGGAEDAEPEQRARDGRDEHAQRDRARVREEAVAVEEIDPEPHELLEAAPALLHGTAAFPRPTARKR